MFGIGSTELLVILVVALIVLGPKSMANISRTLGKALGEFRRVSTDFQRTLNAEVEEEEQKKRKKEAAQAAREAARAEAEAAQAAAQAAGQVAGQATEQPAGQAEGQTPQADAQTAEPQDTPAAEAVLDTTAVHPEQSADQAQAAAEAQTASQHAPEAATEADQPQASPASGAENDDTGVPVPPEGSPLAEALARTEAEARAAEARLAQTATASENGGKA